MNRVAKIRISAALCIVFLFSSSAFGSLVKDIAVGIAKEAGKELLKTTWDYFTRTDEQWLFSYAAHGDAQNVKYYLGKGLDVNLRDKSGRTPIFYAAASGSLATVQVLIDAGADVRIEDKEGLRARDYTDNKKIISALDGARTCCGKMKDNKWWIIGGVIVLFGMIAGIGSKS